MSNTIPLPEKYSEFSIQMYEANKNDHKLKIHLTAQEIREHNQVFYTGEYFSTNNYMGGAVMVNKNGFTYYGLSVNGTEINGTYEIFYR